MKEKKHIDRIFFEKLKDLEATPEYLVWNKIDETLHAARSKKRSTLVWQKISGIAIVLLLSLGLFQWFNQVKPFSTTLGLSNSENREIDEQVLSTQKNQRAEDKIRVAQIKTPKKVPHDDVVDINQEDAHDYLSSRRPDRLLESVLTINSLPIEELGQKTISHVKLTSPLAHEKVQTLKIYPNSQEKIALLDQENASKNEQEISRKERWQIQPNFAPIYSNTLSEKGSPIDQQFKDNKKSGQTNMSFGIGVSYAVNDKISIHSGLNKVGVSYETKDVSVSPSTLLGTTLNPWVYLDMGTESETVPKSSIISSSNSKHQSVATAINQSMVFYEIPIELAYTLSKRRLGLSLVGGFSTLFLNENDISVEYNGHSTVLGQANNINRTSFTANLGFGFSYRLSKRISLGVEPIFKYQINTFKAYSGDFNPYFIGLYSGLHIKLGVHYTSS